MTLLDSAFGGLRESHPLSLHLRARFFKKKRKKKGKKKKRKENENVEFLKLFSEFLDFLAKIPELIFERIPAVLRSEKFEWFGPSPIEPFNPGRRRRRRPSSRRPCGTSKFPLPLPLSGHLKSKARVLPGGPGELGERFLAVDIFGEGSVAVAEDRDEVGPLSKPKLKDSIGEGPNHSNFSDRSSVSILSKFRNFRWNCF